MAPMRDAPRPQSSPNQSPNPATSPKPRNVDHKPCTQICGSTSGLQGLQGLQGLKQHPGQSKSAAVRKNQGVGNKPAKPCKPCTAADLPRVLALLAEIDPVTLAVALVQLAEERQPDDALLVALALAVETAHLRMPSPLDDYVDGRFHRNGVLLPEYTNLQRRRYPPTGRRDVWIKYGPAGPPAATRGTA